MSDMNTPQFELARSVGQRLLAAGASDCLLVGDFVRDQLLGAPSEEAELEVYGLNYEQIVGALSCNHDSIKLLEGRLGTVKIGHLLNVSMPRREMKSGMGHKDLMFDVDTTITPHEACARRDFTVNAIGMRLDGSIFDPFGGCHDLRRGILRATSRASRNDPALVLRGMPLAARFGLETEEQTAAMCREMVAEFGTLSAECVWEAWREWAAQGRYPGKGLRLLEQTGWIKCFPVLDTMARTPQDPVWHPEGNVFIHTVHACDAAVTIAQREGLDENQRTVLLLATLCHDFGKIETTVRNDRGRWIAPGHAERGSDLAAAFLRGMHASEQVVDLVLPLVAQHMVTLGMPKHAPPSARVVRRLVRELAPATIHLWAAVCEADSSGRPPKPPQNPGATWLQVAEALVVQDAQPQPLIGGRHLLALGYTPGPTLGSILRAAFEAQRDGCFEDVDGAVRWVREHFPEIRT